MAKTIKYLLVLLGFSACSQPVPAPQPATVETSAEIVVESLRLGAERTEEYLPLLEGKTVGVIANQTSFMGSSHIVDTLLRLGANVKHVFGPEHGFRGNVSRGMKIGDSIDEKTGLKIVSLYGDNRKPAPQNLEGLDVIVFDIQDVGVRFFTYISTMSYVMEACAEHDITMIVMDRPNPNGHYTDGPGVDKKFTSIIGQHQVPVVHGMTVGEYAKMVNGEGWLKGGIQCNLKVIEMENYSHQLTYSLPIKPSPNLPNLKSIYLYPSLCFFEGTIVNEGRGTDKPFQQFGYPKMPNGNSSYTPKFIKGVAETPSFKDQKCNGIDLSVLSEDSLRNMASINLNWLIQAYQDYPEKEKFFNKNFFDKLAGSTVLREQIIAEKSADDIRKTWEPELQRFKTMRKKYLLYP